MNIAEFVFRKRTVVLAVSVALALAGVRSYFRLGRLEDPEYTIRAAQILTEYPGASAEEVAERITDPIETAVQRLGKLKHVTSVSYPGRSIVMVELKDSFTGDELPQIWDELRRKVSDMASALPAGSSTPLVYDDYGDVYGVFYAIHGDGYSLAELRDYAKTLRRELLLCTDVAKVDLIGERREVVAIDLPRGKTAALGITPERVANALAGQDAATDAGRLKLGAKEMRVSPDGEFRSVEELNDVLIGENLFLGDVAEIHRDYEDPPAVIVRRNGELSIGLGISTAKGGNVVRMGEAVSARLDELKDQTPLGIEVDVISHQATSVTQAVDGFVINLIESVLLVVAVLLFSMGIRSGLVIGAVLILTVLATVFVMDLSGILFERISLGAFIIALGMLVDNAIVVTEAVLVASKQGRSLKEAAVAIVGQTKWALLGGTVIAILSFAPIGGSRNAAGEYCRSLYLVIAISLFLSWVFAITVTPLLAEWGLKRKGAVDAKNASPYGGAFYRGYRRFLESCIDHKFLTLLTLLALLFASVWGFGAVKKNFFPDSTRAQFMVHIWRGEGTQVEETDRTAQELSRWIRRLDGVTGVSTFSGSGALRFLLTYTPEDADSAYALMLVDVADYKLIDALMAKIEAKAPDLAPEALVSAQRFVLGPGDPLKLQMRILGPDPKVLRSLAESALAVLRADGRLKEIQSDWRNRAELVRPDVSEVRARKLGLSRADVARAMKQATDGLVVGTYLERDDALPIVLRSPARERLSPEDLTFAWVRSNVSGRSVPLSQLLDGAVQTTEEMRLQRRDRSYTITVKCNPTGEETAAEAFDRIRPKLEELARTFPVGYRVEWGGEYENSKEANETLSPTFAPILALMTLVVVMLFNSLRKTAVIFLTLPLILVGVVLGLLVFRQPFGFMALLGLLSLVGMQVKNAIVLMDEISANLARGEDGYAAIVDAGVSRLRPVANASLTTVLGMLPLLTDAFYVAMAVTIMVGLAFATVLTMVVIPVNYALIYRIRRGQ